MYLLLQKKISTIENELADFFKDSQIYKMIIELKDYFFKNCFLTDYKCGTLAENKSG